MNATYSNYMLELGMDDHGEIRMSQGSSTDPAPPFDNPDWPGINVNSGQSATSALNMTRAAAFQVREEDMLSDREHSDECDTVAHFIRGMFNQDWQTLRDRMNGPLMVPTKLSHLQPQAKSRSTGLNKCVRFASPQQWVTEQFLETFANEIMCIVTSSFALIQASEERGAQKESDAGKVLHALAFRIICSTYSLQTEEDCTVKDQSEKVQSSLGLTPAEVTSSGEEFDTDSGDDPLVEDCYICAYLKRKFLDCTHKLKACFKRDKPSSSALTVCPQKVTHDLSAEGFQSTSRNALKKFLQRNQIWLSPDTVHSERTVDTVASELLGTVVNAAHDLCQPHMAKNVRVSEESLTEKALDLKGNLNVILLRFFTQTDSLPASESPRDELMRSLEDAQIISKSKLSQFATLLTDRVYKKFCQQAVSEHNEALLDPTSEAHTFPEDVQSHRAPAEMVPSKQVYAFVAEAVTRLLQSLHFPPPNSACVNSQSGVLSAAAPEADVSAMSRLVPDDIVDRTCALTPEPEEEEAEPVEQLFAP